MSEENVEIARKAIEAWNTGDMDALQDLYDPDAVYVTPSDWIGGPYVGRNAVMEQFAELRDIYGDTSFEGTDALDAGDCVVVQVAFPPTRVVSHSPPMWRGCTPFARG